MKLFIRFLILFLIKSSISVNLDDYSINKFIDRLKVNGLYKAIQLIKEFYG